MHYALGLDLEKCSLPVLNISKVIPHISIDNYSFVWYILIEVGKLLIGSVVKNEAVRNQKMICEYESLLTKLPKGSVTCRKNGYYYLRYREDGKIYDRAL